VAREGGGGDEGFGDPGIDAAGSEVRVGLPPSVGPISRAFGFAKVCSAQPGALRDLRPLGATRASGFRSLWGRVGAKFVKRLPHGQEGPESGERNAALRHGRRPAVTAAVFSAGARRP